MSRWGITFIERRPATRAVRSDFSQKGCAEVVLEMCQLPTRALQAGCFGDLGLVPRKSQLLEPRGTPASEH